MSPEYFHKRLTFAEAADYMEGLTMSYRNNWEQARLIADVVARCAGNKSGINLHFPWEREQLEEIFRPPTEEEKKRLESMQVYIKNFFDKRKGTGK